eukprot:CAMPEP_0113513010 /NCGR_PEP_ID=MMETSP0014_2-20120614/39631_1 /TAXON_ID=2857 /ORGANISM="Nitzschia sp." /LENGTH=294 /DNA_ID=CAMNT_0000409379 /DNA_START=39 /DNA_END=923 /DNA_ORIENTATION=+ /assembly_acc=CAM_ASM_000159
MVTMRRMIDVAAAATAATKLACSRRLTNGLSSMSSSPRFRSAVVSTTSAIPTATMTKMYFSCQSLAFGRGWISSTSLLGLLPTSAYSRSLPSFDHRSSFHTSTVVELPVRRRKRAGGSGLGSNNGSNTASGINGGVVAADRSSPRQTQQQEQEPRPSDETTDGENASATAVPEPIKHPPIQDVQIFRHAASALLDRLETALHPMKSKNEVFVISREDGDIGEIFKLDLGPSVGHYLIEISEDECLMQYSSPISGQILYFLSDSTNEWLAVDDGHSFEGIFVRDLIRQCQGLPNL